MAISADALTNLARAANLRIEALNLPTGPGEPQDFQIVPAALAFVPTPSAVPSLTSSSLLNGVIATESVLTAAIPVKMTVEWSVEDQAGNALGVKEALVCTRPADYAADLAHSLMATVMVLPDFVELTKDLPLPPVKTRYVTATVVLALETNGRTIAEQKVQLLRVPVTVPPLPIPTLAVLFENKFLGVQGPNDSDPGALQPGDNYALVVVPKSSPLADIAALRSLFHTFARISATLDTVKSLAGVGLDVLGEVLGAILPLVRALDRHVIGSDVGFNIVAADRIEDLNDITMIQRNPVHNDTEAEDNISSLVLVGPPGRRLRCFVDTYFENRALIVETGDACIAIIEELTDAPVDVKPQISGLAPPKTKQTDDGLDNRMSSLAFL